MGDRLPTWREMCAIKGMFWADDDCVIQYHPPAAEYVNFHEVLHLWRHPTKPIPMPPTVLV